jgi:tyrosyl-tRNA synthetase
VRDHRRVSDLLDDLEWRGLIAQTTDRTALAAALEGGPLTLYCGFDPTAESMQVGNLVPLLLLRRFQLAGHRPIAVVGGATGLVGDPSGKAGERTLHTPEVVAARAQAFRRQLGRFLDLEGVHGALVVDNLTWTAGLGALEFLRDVGKNFTVNAMLAKESVSSRLGAESGISFTEFSYMLLQALDYLELYRRHDCRLQVGGSDQWGNITAGMDLIRRVEGPAARVHCLTTPLVTSVTGEKFGKSEGNAVWLDAERTSPYAFYQFWINVDDADAIGYLRTFTFLDRERIEELAGAVRSRPGSRDAQRALAAEMTELVHGGQARERVEQASRALFGAGELDGLDAETLAAARQEAGGPQLAAGQALPTVVDLLVAAGLVGGRNEARRAITQGGAYLNNQRVSDPEAVPSTEDLLHGRFLVVRRGARTMGVVERLPD